MGCGVQRGREAAEKAAAEAAVAERLRVERVAPFQRIAEAIAARGYRMTRPQFSFQKNAGVLLPWLEPCGNGHTLHFPALLYYPEAMSMAYHDTIEDVCELDTIASHLDTVRCPTNSAPMRSSLPSVHCARAGCRVLLNYEPGGVSSCALGRNFDCTSVWPWTSMPAHVDATHAATCTMTHPTQHPS
jgi:hypothetical protein